MTPMLITDLLHMSAQFSLRRTDFFGQGRLCRRREKDWRAPESRLNAYVRPGYFHRFFIWSSCCVGAAFVQGDLRPFGIGPGDGPFRRPPLICCHAKSYQAINCHASEPARTNKKDAQNFGCKRGSDTLAAVVHLTRIGRRQSK